MQRTLFNWCILPLFRMLFFTDIPSFAVLKLFSLKPNAVSVVSQWF